MISGNAASFMELDILAHFKHSTRAQLLVDQELLLLISAKIFIRVEGGNF